MRTITVALAATLLAAVVGPAHAEPLDPLSEADGVRLARGGWDTDWRIPGTDTMMAGLDPSIYPPGPVRAARGA